MRRMPGRRIITIIIEMDTIPFLQLLQLTDSAAPIGAAAHSFGLETLVVEGFLTIASLEMYLRDYLAEAGAFEAACCRAAYRLAETCDFASAWTRMNAQIDARKAARESRAASATLGRRLLQMAASLTSSAILADALQVAKQENASIHHCAAFGLAASVIGVEEDTSALAYLQQSLTSVVSAAQRLMPLGQQAASHLLWSLKPAVADAVLTDEPGNVGMFMPLLETGSMRHPHLATRLFIS